MGKLGKTGNLSICSESNLEAYGGTCYNAFVLPHGRFASGRFAPLLRSFSTDIVLPCGTVVSPQVVSHQFLNRLSCTIFHFVIVGN